MRQHPFSSLNGALRVQGVFLLSEWLRSLRAIRNCPTPIVSTSQVLKKQRTLQCSFFNNHIGSCFLWRSLLLIFNCYLLLFNQLTQWLRTKTPAHKADQTLKDPTVCDLCGTKVARKGDIPRHMRRHLSAEDKAAKSYACPYPDCGYTNLQKGNVDTHIRTHTKVKNQQCPSCDFATVDPGSLTRHRKRRHQYVPKERKPRTPGSGPPGPQQEQMIIETPSTFTTEGLYSDGSTSPSSSRGSSALHQYDSDATQSTPTSVYTVFTPPLTLPSVAMDSYTFPRPSLCSSKIRGPLDLLDALSEKSQEGYWERALHSSKSKALSPGYQSTPPLESDDLEVVDAVSSFKVVCRPYENYGPRGHSSVAESQSLRIFSPSNQAELSAAYSRMPQSEVSSIDERHSAHFDLPLPEPDNPSIAASDSETLSEVDSWITFMPQ
ncbi:hypothetical protein BT96DRAFT_988417 [Gymnopus androsaceus JB14]|uniref:C2H2-type domain-containing protein n=1 Tax=Gymnopus androsaceus JB14 TaxID=1447944 RepID=A0A6A4I3N8_9AGAR|nr:hypothetical protein BT96DRAFT_988417 [Gymnopus androsaceus JB14]